MSASAPKTMRIAAIQACPIFLDRAATIDRACDLVRAAAGNGAQLVVFPEAFVPCYPVWSWFIPPARTPELRALYAELVDQSMVVPSAATDALCDVARERNVFIVIGINERNIEASGTTLYNTLLYIGADGAILGRHRKLIPTSAERMVWAQGDGSDLETYETPFGRLSGLICWENYMPLARYALYAWGTAIYCAPTWDRGEPWISTLRHIAKEGRCVVIGVCSAMRKSDIPDRFPFRDTYMQSVGEWLNPGDSAIVDPDGKFLAGPAHEEETILYADVQHTSITGPRVQLDVAGHYARPDVFELHMHREPRPLIHYSAEPALRL